MVNDQRLPVNVAHPLDIINLGAYGKRGPFLDFFIHRKFGKTGHMGSVALFIPGHRLLQALNPARKELRLFLGLVYHLHPFSVDALHISFQCHLSDCPSYGIPGTLKFPDQHILRGQHFLTGIYPILNPAPQFRIYLVILRLSHIHLTILHPPGLQENARLY